MTNIESVVKNLFFKEVVAVVIKKIIVAVPFLGWPVIGNFFNWFMIKIAEKFYAEMALHGAFLVIDFKVDGERRRYEIATGELRDVLKSPNRTEEEKERAKNEFKKRLRDLIRFNVS